MLLRDRADQAAAIDYRGGGGLRAQDRRGAGMLGRKDCTGEAKTFTPCHACSPPPKPSPLPQLRVGRPGRRLVPGTGGVRGGLVEGGREKGMSSRDGSSSVLAGGGVEGDAISGKSSGGRGGCWRSRAHGAGSGDRAAEGGARPPEQSRVAVRAVRLPRSMQRSMCGRKAGKPTTMSPRGWPGGSRAERGSGRGAARGLP